MPFLRKIRNKTGKKTKNKIRIVTLQVRKPPNHITFTGKRVLVLTSFKKSASLTVEAAFVLPLFLFATVTLLTPLKMMDQQRQIQASLETVCEDISQFAYLHYREELSDPQAIPKNGDWKSEFSKYFEGPGVALYVQALMKSKVDTGLVERISLADSKVLEDGETIDLVMNYRLKLPFPIFRMASIPMTARSCRRGWIGRAGGRGTGSGADEEIEDPIVYVGRSSTRYHRLRTCHYLYNDVTQVTFDDLESYRNSGGGRYYPCGRCGSGARSGGVVYIMPSGGSYHSDRNCSAIAAYVKAVLLSTVSYLGPCSYCSE